MTTATPKRLAADILRTDLELLTDYWQERLEGCGIKLTDDEATEIQDHIDNIIAPFAARLDTIAKDVNILDRNK